MPAESWADLLSNAGDAADAYEIIPVGEYDVTVTKAETDFAKSSGNKMYKLTLVIESGPYANRNLWKNLSIPQSAPGAKVFFRQMAALTLDGNFFRDEPTDDVVTAAMLNKRASAKVQHDSSYDGTPRAQVSFLNKPKGPAPVGGVGAAAASPADDLGLPAPSPAAASVVDDVPAPAAAAPAAADPWANASPPSMAGLGQEDPF